MHSFRSCLCCITKTRRRVAACKHTYEQARQLTISIMAGPCSVLVIHESCSPGLALGVSVCRRSTSERHIASAGTSMSESGRHSRSDDSLPEQPGLMSTAGGATGPVVIAGTSPELCVPACPQRM